MSNNRVKFAVHVNRMKPFVDPDERPIQPPEEEVDEPYLDLCDIPDDSFDNTTNENRECEQNAQAGDQEENEGKTDDVSGKQSNVNTDAEMEDHVSEAQVQDDSNSQVIDNVNIFAAEKILKKRMRKGKIQYLVKWSNFPKSASTWEPEDNILDQRLITEFNSS